MTATRMENMKTGGATRAPACNTQGVADGGQASVITALSRFFILSCAHPFIHHTQSTGNINGSRNNNHLH